jgi:hypothetical protein
VYGGDLKVKFEPSQMIQDENGFLLHPMKEGSKIKYGAFDLTIS